MFWKKTDPLKKFSELVKQENEVPTGVVTVIIQIDGGDIAVFQRPISTQQLVTTVEGEPSLGVSLHAVRFKSVEALMELSDMLVTDEDNETLMEAMSHWREDEDA